MKQENLIWCSGCGEYHPESEFYRNNGRIMTPCKEIRKLQASESFEIGEFASVRDRVKKLRTMKVNRRAGRLVKWLESGEIKAKELRVILNELLKETNHEHGKEVC